MDIPLVFIHGLKGSSIVDEKGRTHYINLWQGMLKFIFFCFLLLLVDDKSTILTTIYNCINNIDIIIYSILLKHIFVDKQHHIILCIQVLMMLIYLSFHKINDEDINYITRIGFVCSTTCFTFGMGRYIPPFITSFSPFILLLFFLIIFKYIQKRRQVTIGSRWEAEDRWVESRQDLR